MPSRRLGFRSWRGRERDDGLENWGCAVIIRDEMCRGVAVSLLPQELQGRIYAAALTHDGALHFGFDIVDYNCYSTLVHTNAAALAPLLHGLPRACKALRSQSRPLVLRENVFAFALWREKEQSGDYSFHFAMQAVGEVFDEMGRRGCAEIRTVHVDSATWSLDWVEEEGMLDVAAFAQGLSRRLGKGRARVAVGMRFEMEDFAPVEGLEAGGVGFVSVTPGRVEESVAAARAAVEGESGGVG
ncbi:hypothetical protein LTR54_000056 [Friedmanniomyces endolithicus]|nr:hypothetical protein LTS00_009005 [Friedmanniomyces endolithicus]KAK1019414.1 hypothetical protein LTR54_000056 [Friedmanniomyces endolithicus]